VSGSVIVVVGTLGGAIVGALGALGLDFVRWRRERDARWDEQRLLSYSRYLACAAQVHAEAVSPARGAEARVQGVARFNKRYNALASIYEELVLLDPAVQPDARRLLWILWNLHEMAKQDGVALAIVAEATRTYQDARFHIRKIAIEHLRLSVSGLSDVERCNVEAHDAEIGHVPRSSPWA
jgi:predicted acylesterase/phospholipase RssA